jgi:hypothetical protein
VKHGQIADFSAEFSGEFSGEVPDRQIGPVLT